MAYIARLESQNTGCALLTVHLTRRSETTPGAVLLTVSSASLDDLCLLLQRFAAQKGRPRGDLPALIHELGLNQSVLNQSWTDLSVRQCATEACRLCCVCKSPLLTIGLCH